MSIFFLFFFSAVHNFYEGFFFSLRGFEGLVSILLWVLNDIQS